MVKIVYVGFFFVNDHKNVDLKCLQTMKCFQVCYNILVLFCKFPKTQTRKGPILYNTTNGVTTLKKHMNVNDYIIAKMFEEEMNNLLKKEMERKPTKKKSHPLISSAIINFFVTKNSFQKNIYNIKKLLRIWAC
jgi:hypothetical protein